MKRTEKTFNKWSDVEKLVSGVVAEKLKAGYVLDIEHNNTSYGGFEVRYFLRDDVDGEIISVDVEESRMNIKYDGEYIYISKLTVDVRSYRSGKDRYWDDDADEKHNITTLYALPSKKSFANIKEKTFVELYDYACQSMVSHSRRCSEHYDTRKSIEFRSVMPINKKIIEMVRTKRGFKRVAVADMKKVCKKKVEMYDGDTQVEYAVDIYGKGYCVLAYTVHPHKK